MSRYTGPSCRLCRREGTKLFLKGTRCFTEKCAVERRRTRRASTASGRPAPQGVGVRQAAAREAEGQAHVRPAEAQFRNTFERVRRRQPGVTGNNLLVALETPARQHRVPDGIRARAARRRASWCATATSRSTAARWTSRSYQRACRARKSACARRAASSVGGAGWRWSRRRAAPPVSWLAVDRRQGGRPAARAPDPRCHPDRAPGTVDRRALLEVGHGMTIDLTGLVRPQLVEMTKREDNPNIAEFRLQPLERGFGYTLGNALRRMLLSSLRGLRRLGLPHRRRAARAPDRAGRRRGRAPDHPAPQGADAGARRRRRRGGRCTSKRDGRARSTRATSRPRRRSGSSIPTTCSSRCRTTATSNCELYVNKGRGYVEADLHPADRSLSGGPRAHRLDLQPGAPRQLHRRRDPRRPAHRLRPPHADGRDQRHASRPRTLA